MLSCLTCAQAGKSLFTTIRELVENSLDAAEAVGILPSIEVSVSEMTRDTLNASLGVGKAVRLNEALYTDFVQKKKVFPVL